MPDYELLKKRHGFIRDILFIIVLVVFVGLVLGDLWQGAREAFRYYSKNSLHLPLIVGASVLIGVLIGLFHGWYVRCTKTGQRILRVIGWMLLSIPCATMVIESGMIVAAVFRLPGFKDDTGVMNNVYAENIHINVIGFVLGLISFCLLVWLSYREFRPARSGPGGPSHSSIPRSDR